MIQHVKKYFAVIGLMAALSAFSADFFSCYFTPRMAGRSRGRTIEPLYYDGHRGHQTVTGYGNSGRAAMFAMENLQDFRLAFGPHPQTELPAVIYANLSNFPKERGYCEIHVAPFFNQIHAYRQKNDTTLRCSYVLNLYEAAGADAKEHSGKSEIALYFKDRTLYLRFRFTDGQEVTLSTPVKDWRKEAFHKVTFAWSKGKLEFFIDRRLVASAKTQGTLGDFNALELGGRGLDLSLQGMVDDVRIVDGYPAEVFPPGYEGDPKKFKEIPVAAEKLANWNVPAENADKISVVSGKAPRFTYTGGTESTIYAWMKETIPVRPNSFIRGDVTLLKKQWNFGSRAEIVLEFLNKKGKRVKLLQIDGRSGINLYAAPTPMAVLRSFSGIGCDLAYFNYWRIPPKATQLRLGVGFSGNGSELHLKSWRMREVDPSLSPWFRQPLKGKQLTYEKSPAATDEAVQEMLKKRTVPVSTLVRQGDRVEWMIDGKKIPARILANPMIGSYSRVVDFREAGYKLVTSWVNFGRTGWSGDFGQIWREDGTLDLKPLEEAVYRVLREAPDAYVILHLCLMPNARWLKENQAELMLYTDGLPAVIKHLHIQKRSSKNFPKASDESWVPSFHSRKYRKDVAAMLDKALKEFEKSPASRAVVGIYVTGGDDGQFRAPKTPELSPLALKAFHEYLTKKYGTSENLARAWRQEGLRIEDVKMPAPEDLEPKDKIVFSLQGSTLESDYREFLVMECADFKNAMRRAVKQAVPRLLVGGYDNAMSLDANPGFGMGRFSMKELIEEPYCDFLISLPAYGIERSECTLPLGMKAYNGSMLLHKKLIVSEMDIRNPEQPPLSPSYSRSNWQATHNYGTFNKFLQLYTGYAAAWGGGYHAYSLGRFMYETPEAVAAWKKVATLFEAAEGEELNGNRIAWIGDDRPFDFFSTAQQGNAVIASWNRNICQALWLGQIRFDTFLPGDLYHPDFKAPKIMLFGNPGCLSTQQIQKIRRDFLRDKRTLIWIGTPALFTGATEKEISAALGIAITHPQEIRKRSIVAAGNDPLVKGIHGYLYSPIQSASAVHFGNAAFAPGADGKVLGTYQGTELPGAVVKRHPDATEIFIGQPGAMTPELLRNIARAAGIVPVTDRNDLLICGGGFICLGASTGDGERTIRIPVGVKRLECLTGQKILSQDASGVKVDLKYGDCAIFKCIKK